VQQPLGVQLPGVLTTGARLTVAVGGVRTSVTSSEPSLALTLPDAVSRFAVPSDDGTSRPDIEIAARWGAAPPLADGRLLFDSGGLWRLDGNDRHLRFRFTSPTFGAAPYKTAVFDRDFASGTVYLNGGALDATAAQYPLEYPLDELVVTNFLALGRGVEMHACGVQDADGRGLLFLGHSGAGKSTIAALWRERPGVTILSDDRIILREDADGIWMYGTPWHGDERLAEPMRVRLTRGFFLRHAPRTVATTLSGVHVVARLIACSFPPFYSAHALDFVLQFLARVSDCTPLDELSLVPEPLAIDIIRAIR
jgi:hypothetical protein